MDFDLPALLAAHRDDGYELYGRYLNPQQPKVLHAIGFDKVYERAEGAYLYDSDGHQYADFLAGFGVFAAGRNHPVIRQALHDALDAQLADWTQFDCGPLPGLLAQRLLAKAPGLDRVFFCNSGTEAVESALKFARYATGRRRVIYCDHAFHGLTTGLAVGQRLGRVPPAGSARCCPTPPSRSATWTRSRPNCARATSRRSSSSPSRARACTCRRTAS